MKYNKILIFFKFLVVFVILTSGAPESFFYSGGAFSAARAYAQQTEEASLTAAKSIPAAVAADKKEAAPVKQNAKKTLAKKKEAEPESVFIAGRVFAFKTTALSPFEISYHYNYRFKKPVRPHGFSSSQLPPARFFYEILSPVSGEVVLSRNGTLETTLADDDGFFSFKIKESELNYEISLNYKSPGAAYFSGDGVFFRPAKGGTCLVKMLIAANNNTRLLTAAAGTKPAAAAGLFKKNAMEQIAKISKTAKKVTAVNGRIFDFKGLKNIKLSMEPDKKNAAPDKNGYFKFTGGFGEGRRIIGAKSSDGMYKTVEINLIRPDYGFSLEGTRIKFNSAPLISGLSVSGGRGDIEIFYDLIDEDSDECLISFQYSVDNGATFKTSENIIDSSYHAGLWGMNPFRRKMIWRSGLDIKDNPNNVVIAIAAADKKEKTLLQSRSFSLRNNNRPDLSGVIISGSSDEINISYDISDADNDTCAIFVHYSLDNGLSFLKTDSISGNINYVTPGAGKKIIWRSRDNIKIDNHNVKIKLAAFDGIEESAQFISTALSLFNNLRRPEVKINNISGDSNEIEIGYSLSDSDENLCLIEASYSLDSKKFIRTTSVSGDINSVKPAANLKLKWNSRNDLKLDTDTLYIELTAFDGTGYGNKSVYGPVKLNNNRPPKVENIYPADISGEIVIYYDLIDEEMDTCGVEFNYSLDNGLTFSGRGNITGEISSVRPGVRRMIKWKTRPELNGDYDGVKVKLTASQKPLKYGKPMISPPFSIRNNRAPGVSNIICDGGSNEIEVKFDLSDADNHECTVEVYFSIDGGNNFFKTSNFTCAESPLKPGRGRVIKWLSHLDFHTSEEKTRLKIIPYDAYTKGYEAAGEIFSVNNNAAPVITNIKISGDSDEICISYDLYDAENNTCEIKLWYLTPDAKEFVKSVNASGEIKNVQTGAGKKIIWKSRLDFTRDYDRVIVKLSADDGNLKSADSVSEPFKVFNNRPPVISNISVSPDYGDISVNFDIFDPDGDDCDIELMYSVDNGVNFSVTKNISGELKKVKSGGAAKTVKWSSASDFLKDCDQTVIRIAASDKSGRGPAADYGPFKVNNSGLCSISNVSVVRDKGETYQITYDLEALNDGLCTVEVYYSLDGGNFAEDNKVNDLRGEVVNVRPGKNKKMIWDPSSDLMISSKIYLKLSPVDAKARGGAGVSKSFNIDNSLLEVKLMPEIWPREGHGHMCLNGKMYIIGGWAGSPNYYNDVTIVECDPESGSSEVEISQNHYASVRYSYSGAVYDDKMWIMGGFFNKSKNDVWYSSDGTTWVEITKNETESVKFGVRDSHASVVFDDGFGRKLFVIGGFSSGYKNDVWCSVTGAQWTCITGETSFSPRVGHGAAVFDNNIYLIGGYDGEKYKNDVWRSPDGIRWEQVLEKAPFERRRGHAVIVFKDRIWLIGGYGENEKYYNDIWCSSDGLNWRQVKAVTPENAGFTPRRGHSAVVYKDKLWIFGGYDGTNYKGDLWRTR